MSKVYIRVVAVHAVMVFKFPLTACVYVLYCGIIGCLISAAGVLDRPVQSSRSGGMQCEALEEHTQQEREAVEEQFNEEREEMKGTGGDGAETSLLCCRAIYKLHTSKTLHKGVIFSQK